MFRNEYKGFEIHECTKKYYAICKGGRWSAIEFSSIKEAQEYIDKVHNQMQKENTK